MKKILVPVDFSKDSMNALESAVSLANNTGSDLTFIHVRKSKDYDEPFVISGSEQNYGHTVEDFCEKIVKDYEKQIGSGKIDFVISYGKIYKAVIDQAEKDDVDLIMMGTHGVSGFEEIWLGSNSYRVVSKAPCPVLTVRHGFDLKKISKILLPIDAKRDTRQKIPFTTEFARILGAEVHVVDFRTTGRASIIFRLRTLGDQAFKYVQKQGVKAVRHSIKGKDLSETIIEYAKENHMDLISIVTFERGTPANMALSTSAQQMVNHSPVPVLSVHPKF